MSEIIPSINVENLEEAKRRIKLVEHYVHWIHLDVSDGKFTPNVSWGSPGDVKKIKTDLDIEAHLMLQNPIKTIDDWLYCGAKRLIFHIESTENMDILIEKCRRDNVEVGIALNPETSVDELDQYIQNIKLVQTLGVRPGLSGQVFEERVYEKIKSLHNKYPELLIEVDGGVDKQVARKAAEAGANIFVSATAIFRSNNVGEAIRALERAVILNVRL